MILILEQISSLGANTVSFTWLPVSIWTLFAAFVLLVLNLFRSTHVQYHYHVRLALFFALPAGLLITGMIDVAAAWWGSGVEAATNLKFISVHAPVELTVVNADSSSMSNVNMNWYGIGIAVFSAGVILFFSRYLQQLLQLHHLTRQLTLRRIETIGKINPQNIELAGACGRPVYLAFLNRPIIPVTYGIWRPVILLPSLLEVEPEKMNMVLYHELIHIRNRDYMTQLIMSGVRTLFWVHPFVHILYYQLIEYRELCCDSQVLSEGSISRKKYASVLLELLPMPNLNKNVSVTMAQESSNLKKRINMINQKRTKSIPFKASFSLFCGVILATVLAMSCTDMQSHSEFDEEELNLMTDHADSMITEDANDEASYFVVVEQMPELIGGLATLQEKLVYPEEAKRAGIEGRIFVQFIVNEEGKVESPRVIRGIGGGADEAALDLVRQATFRPGMQRGSPVKVQYSLPILFSLNESPQIESKEVSELLFRFERLERQDAIISGKVLDKESNQPLAGANVIVVNSHKGTTTDPAGSFSLSIDADEEVEIMISYVGYKPLRARM